MSFLINFFAFAISICSLGLQLSILPIFLVHADYRQLVSYRVMMAIGICECLEVLPPLLFATISIFGVQWPAFLEKLGGAIVMVNWDVVVMLHFLLALDRFLIVFNAFTRPASALHAAEFRYEKKIFNFFFLFLGLYFIAGMALFLSPKAGIYFDSENQIWSYNNLAWTDIMSQTEFFLTSAMPMGAFCLYLGIVVMLKWSRRNMSTVTTIHVTNRQQTGQSPRITQYAPLPLINPQERRILVQSMVLFVFESFLLISWYLENPLYVITAQSWILFTNFCWLLFLGINPLLYLIMNREFRHRFLHFWWFKKLRGWWQTESQ